MSENVQAIMIFEVMGKPAEYLAEALNGIGENITKEKGIKIKSKKINEPKAIEKSDLFTNFMELELEIENVTKLLLVMFNYMPAHIEILEPNELRIKNFDLNAICNDLMTKLHGYDSVAKTLLHERANLINQIGHLSGKVKEMLPTVSEVSPAKKKKKR